MKKQNILGLSLLTINPFLSMVYSFVQQKNRSNYLMFSISCGILFNSLPIFFDTASNYMMYFIGKNYNANIKLYNKIPVYLNKISFHYIHWIMISTTIIVYTLLYLIRKEGDKNPYLKKSYLNLLFPLMLTLREVQDLNRFMLGALLMCCSLLYFSRLQKIGIIIFSYYIHTASLMFLLVYLISKFFDFQKYLKKNKIGYKNIIFIILSILIFRIGLEVLPYILKLIDSHLYIKFINYSTNEAWGKTSLINMPLKLLGIKLLTLIPIILSLIYSIKNVKMIKNKEVFNMFVTLFLLCFIFFEYRVFFERLSIITLVLALSIYSTTYIKKDRLALTIIIIISIFIRSFWINIICYGWVFTNQYDVFTNKNIVIKNIEKSFYLPLPLLLDVNKNGYSDELIFKNSTRNRARLKYY